MISNVGGAFNGNSFPVDWYPYIDELLSLQSCSAQPPKAVPAVLRGNPSPLRWQDWEYALANHPDRCFADYIVGGIRTGFRVGFDYDHHCVKAKNNMHSAREHPEIIREYLAKECAEGRILGPFPPASLPGVQVSRFGVIPKKGLNKWRLILDLSPEGRSVNDGIRQELCSLSYVSIDDAARAVARAGRGALLAKIDIKSAYRIVGVHPEDRLLLGMLWDEELYVDTALPFGLRSAPKIFTALADALEWVVRQTGVKVMLHYLDDFLLVGEPASEQCKDNLQKLLAVFTSLHIPVASEKLEGPTTCLSFLGIELDTYLMVLRLPQEKIEELRALLAHWRTKKWCLLKDLQSLVGKLQHACKVVRPGRTFLRRMFELLRGTPKRQCFIRLNATFRSDLAWWLMFLESWNGVSMLADVDNAPPDAHLYTDASGGIGCGAWSGRHWFQYFWPDEFAARSIAVKELVPIVMACIVWGKIWRQQNVLAHCDNQAVVEVINTGSCKDPELMQLLRSLFFITAHLEITLRAAHIPGLLNTGADALSRDNLILFHSQVPAARPSPTPLPPAAIDLLIHCRPDWMSPSWSQLFRDCLQRV